MDRVKKSCVWLATALTLGVLSLTAATTAGQSATATSLARPSPSVRPVVFEVRGLRSDRGQVMGALFDRPERWVRAGQEVATCHAPIRGGAARCEMTVPAGRYAFAFAHDEDRDGQLDRDFLGIPQEGYGFSNDVRPSLALPSWHSAAFEVLAAAGRRLVVTTRYGI